MSRKSGRYIIETAAAGGKTETHLYISEAESPPETSHPLHVRTYIYDLPYTQ